MLTELIYSFLLILFISLLYYLYHNKNKIKEYLFNNKKQRILKNLILKKKIKTDNKIYSLILLNDNKKFATIENDGYIYIYNLDSYSIYQTLKLPNSEIHFLTQFKNNFLAACVSNSIIIYSLDSELKFQLYRTLYGHTNEVFYVIESNKNDIMISVDYGKKINIWKKNKNNDYNITSTIIDNDFIENILFTNDNETIFVTTYNNNNNICFYDINLLTKIHTINDIKKTHNYYNMIKLQKFLFIGGKDSTIYVIDLNLYRVHYKHQFDVSIGWIECINILNYKNKFIILGGDEDGNLIECDFDFKRGKIKFIDIKEDIFENNILCIIPFNNNNNIFVVSEKIKIFEISNKI